MVQSTTVPFNDDFEPTPAAARARLATVRPAAYARTRNVLDGAVTRLSPYLTHGLLSLPEVLHSVDARHRLPVQHKFVYELGWRAYFRHVWAARGNAILQSLHPGPLPDAAYTCELPADLREARSGVPAIDQAVRQLYATGWLHNHARMWLASYTVHLRKVHWRAGADWMVGHLLDGDLASNHLSWQWVAGTASHKPYLFNADNVARYAPPPWHSRGTVIDTDYDALARIAATPREVGALHPAATGLGALAGVGEPALFGSPPDSLGFVRPDPSRVANRPVWLAHPWSLADPPAGLPPDTVVVAVAEAGWHRAWPWSAQRWAFVGQRMAALAPLRWVADAADLAAALRHARAVFAIDDPHAAGWLHGVATELRPAPALFPPVARRCDSFSKWWHRATRGLDAAAELLEAQPA